MDVKENNLVCIGLISRPHGVKGEVLVKSFTEDPRDLESYSPIQLKNGDQISLTIVGKSKGQFISRIEGLCSRDQCEKLSGELIYVERKVLPSIEGEDEFYHSDLIGMRVVTENGKIIGVITAIYDFGAGDIIEIKKNDESEIMVQFRKSIFKKVDIPREEVIVSENELDKIDQVS